MNKHNTIFGQILAQVERPQFDKLVRDCKHEFGAKGMKSWTQFASMALGQISGQNGLRGIEASMNAQTSSFYHLGISSAEKREVKRSTLSYANNHRTSKLYERLFYKMYEKAGKRSEGHGFRFKNKLYSVDATTIDLCLKLFPWAAFRENKGGVKLTVKLDHRGKIPAFVIFGNAREHESKKIKEIPFEAEDIAVFDRGFTDYGYFRALNDQKVWFVTRLKKNAAYRIIKKNESKSKNIKSDYEIKIPK
jgi:putative transposase